MGKRVGFIGLGMMGKPMARNVLRAGFNLTVYDVDPRPVAELVRDGATAASCSKDVAEISEVVVTVLPSTAEVELVTLGPCRYNRGDKAGSYAY